MLQPFQPQPNKRIDDRPAIDPATESSSKKFKESSVSIEMKVEEAKQERGYIAPHLDAHARYRQLSEKCEKLSQKIKRLQEAPSFEMTDLEKVARTKKIEKQTQKLIKLYEETIALGIELETNPEMQIEKKEASVLSKIPMESAEVVPEMEVETPPTVPLVIKDNPLKKHFIESINAIETIEDLRELARYAQVLSPEDLETMKQAFVDPAVKPATIKFTLVDDNGSVVKDSNGKELIHDLNMPLAFWKVHSPVFAIMGTTQMRTTPCQDTMSISAFKLLPNIFVNGFFSFTNQEDFEDISNFADKYQISWLSNQCTRMLTMVCMPLQEAQGKFAALKFAAEHSSDDTAKAISLCVQSLCKIYQDLKVQTPGAARDLLKQLNDYADEFKLADLKFFATCGNVNINPDGSFIGRYSLSDLENPLYKEPLKQCLAIKNSLYSPKIVLDVDLKLETKFILKDLFQNAQVPFTVKIGGTGYALSAVLKEVLQFIPEIKQLRIVFDCLKSKPVHLIDMLIHNTTLTFLHLTLLNYDNRAGGNNFNTNWPGTAQNLNVLNNPFTYKSDVHAARRDIARAMMANDKIRKKNSIEPLGGPQSFIVMQSNGNIDEKELYTVKGASIKLGRPIVDGVGVGCLAQYLDSYTVVSGSVLIDEIFNIYHNHFAFLYDDVADVEEQ